MLVVELISGFKTIYCMLNFDWNLPEIKQKLKNLKIFVAKNLLKFFQHEKFVKNSILTKKQNISAYKNSSLSLKDILHLKFQSKFTGVRAKAKKMQNFSDMNFYSKFLNNKFNLYLPKRIVAPCLPRFQRQETQNSQAVFNCNDDHLLAA